MKNEKFRSTTIIAVRKDGKVAMAGDGQVTLGETVMKPNAKKVRRIYDGKILTGFAGATADAFTLLERFETRVKEYSGDLVRSAVELAKDWRTDKALRNLQALLLVADSEKTLLISGTGDVIEPAEDVLAIGSGETTPTRLRLPTWKADRLPHGKLLKRACISREESVFIPMNQ